MKPEEQLLTPSNEFTTSRPGGRHFSCCSLICSLIIFAVISLIIGLVLLIGILPVVTWQVNSKLVLSPDGEVLDMWKSPTDPTDKGKFGGGATVTLTAWMFNLTNPEDINSLKIPKLKEVGPYIYQEKRLKENVVFNQDKTEVSFTYKRSHFLLPTGRPDSEKILFPNIALAGVADQVHWNTDMGALAQALIAGCDCNVSYYNTTSVRDMMFGYHDKMLEVAEATGLWPIPSTSIALFLNGTGNGWFSNKSVVYTGKDDISKINNYKSWGGFANFSWWKGDKQIITGSETSVFAPNVKESTVLSVFDDTAYRTGNLIFVENSEVSGIKTKRFGYAPNVFGDTTVDPSNGGYFSYMPGLCNETAVPIDTVFNAPVYISQPYFLGGAQWMRDRNGLSDPNISRHGSYFDIEPTTGMLLSARKRFQVNFLLQPAAQIDSTIQTDYNFAPVGWFEESAEMDPKVIDYVKSQLSLRKTFLILGYVFGGLFVAAALIAGIAAGVLYARRRPNYDELHQQNF